MSGEFASKGVAGSGLGLGIAGTALGVLNSSCNGGGLLGGLFGGNCQMNQVSALQSEISQLKAEKYSDQSIANVYTALRNEVTGLGDRLLEKYINPISQEIADIRVREARTEEQLKCIQKTQELENRLIRSELNGRIDQCCCTMNNGLTILNGAVAQLQQTVGSITSTIIPQTAICPPVMPRYNSFVTPTDTAPATQPVIGTVNAT